MPKRERWQLAPVPFCLFEIHPCGPEKLFFKTLIKSSIKEALKGLLRETCQEPAESR